jgi:hypothetical protein
VDIGSVSDEPAKESRLKADAIAQSFESRTRSDSACKRTNATERAAIT